jgi:hypothetical protein
MLTKIDLRLVVVVLFFICSLCTASLYAQERDIAGFELVLDQDHYADFLLPSVLPQGRNYTIGGRVTVFGYKTDNDKLGLPYVRKQIEGFVVKPILKDLQFRLEQLRHDISFIANGFTPTHISDETSVYNVDRRDTGYELAADRPFSSFTGFRSTRRYEGSRITATTGRKIDYALNSSFTFGVAGLGLTELVQKFFHGIDNFGTSRPVPTLWETDETKDIPTGQALPAGFPLFMYSLSVESVVFRYKKILQLQLRPDVNIGYYTNVGFGFDIGKVMKGEKFIDNLGYTDTNNFSILSVADDYFAYSLVAGGSARIVLYNAHINGLYGLGDRHFIPFNNTRKIVLEGYVGAKMQFIKYLELTASLSTRTPEIKSTNEQRNHYWATLSLKVLLNEYN